MPDLLAAHEHSIRNQAEVEASTECGCFFCLQTFPPSEITAWTGWDPLAAEEPQNDEPMTAVCPRCGSESVIGDKSGYSLTPQFLRNMNEAWFQRTMIMKPGTKR